MEKNIEHNLINKSISFILKMKAFFPKSKRVYFLIYIMKLIPLMVITHDWNLTSKYSISFWIRKFTLSEIISTIKRIELYYIIEAILFIFSLLSFIFFLILKSQMDSEGKICRYYEIHFSIYSYMLFFLFFFIPQFFHSIYIEIILNPISKNKNSIIYIIMICISSIPIINAFCVQIALTSILINEPLFIRNKSPFINKMNNKDFRISIFTTIQAAVQSEFYLSFQNKVILKIIIRALFFIQYIYCFFDYDSYYSNFYEEKFFFFLFFSLFCFFWN